MAGYSLVVIWISGIHTGHTAEQDTSRGAALGNRIGSKVVNTPPLSVGISSGGWQKSEQEKKKKSQQVAEKGQSSLTIFTSQAYCLARSHLPLLLTMATFTVFLVPLLNLIFLLPPHSFKHLLSLDLPLLPPPLPRHTFNPPTQNNQVPCEPLKLVLSFASSCFHQNCPMGEGLLFLFFFFMTAKNLTIFV